MSTDLMSSKTESPYPAVPEDHSGRRPVAVNYIDRAELEETFADSMGGFFFDGQTLRIEFSVTRYDDVKANSPISGRRYPACRLVLPLPAVADLINRLQRVSAAMTQAGVMKRPPANEAHSVLGIHHPH
jgi:hypothetical protein